MISGIYQIRNTVNGKVYVGQSKDLAQRKRVHRRMLLDGKHYNRYLQRSFNKYGEDSFAFEVLEYCKEEHLIKKERQWIKNMNSEYADKGYNAAYAYILFKGYDRNKRINLSERKRVVREYTDESREKFRISIAKYWSQEENIIKKSLSQSVMELETIVKIKTLLKEDLDVTPQEVADKYNVSVNSIHHIIALASHEFISKEFNHIIKNRSDISYKRINKNIIRMYRDGHSYSRIAKENNMHLRTAIRRVMNLCDENDDRCRLNVINRASKKKELKIKTWLNNGYSRAYITKVMTISRGDISKIVNGGYYKEHTDVKETRGKVKPCEYRKLAHRICNNHKGMMTEEEYVEGSKSPVAQ